MDPLADLLSRAHARGAAFSDAVLRAPWGMAFDEPAPLAVHAMLAGLGELVEPGRPAVALGPGDVVLARAPAPHALRSGPDAVCTPLAGTRAWAVDGRARRYENAPGGDAEVLCGAYSFDGALCDGLLAALAPVVVVRAADAGSGMAAAIALLGAEVDHDGPGDQAVLDRLLDLVLVYALRAHFRASAERAPGWFRAVDDPPVARALALVHAEPARGWTVAALGQAVGLSRAAFARRFAAVVGEPPLAYLTGWRMRLAEEALRDPGRTLAVVAQEVGYSNEFAFAAAFKRERGVAPGTWRRARAA